MSTLFLLTYAFSIDTRGELGNDYGMTENQVVAILKKKQGDGSLRSLAIELGISAAYLSDIYLGRRRIGPKILRPLGLRQVTERTTRYERVK